MKENRRKRSEKD